MKNIHHVLTMLFLTVFAFQLQAQEISAAKTKKLASHADGEYFLSAVSPDGRKILLSEPGLMTLDGRKTECLFSGWLDPGVKTIPWNPSALTSDGICLVRLESRKNPEDLPAVATVKCVITRQQ